MSKTVSERQMALLNHNFGPEMIKLLEDNAITDIMKNGDGRIWVKKLGCKEHIDTGICLAPNAALQIVETIASLTNTVCNTEKTRVSAELPGNGHRFEGIIPPVTETATFAIRKKTLLRLTLDDYYQKKALTLTQKNRLIKGVWDYENILVAGGTGSGKTTFTNGVLSEMAKTTDRILTIQDTIELQCPCENKVEMRTGDYTSIDDCIKSALRYYPKRIVIGEIRGAEAYSMLDAWGTGHPGGLCTIHSNSARHTLERLERLVRIVSQHSQRETIAETIGLIVYMEEAASGHRVREMVEVKGLKNNDYVFQEVI